MIDVAHLVVGPEQHGVVRHAVEVARGCGQRVLRVDDAAAAVALDYSAVDVVHVAFTDRLFGRTCEESAQAFASTAARIAEHGAQLSVTLHDIPRSDTVLDRRRRDAYASVAAPARGVVVSSLVELEAVQDMAAGAHSLRCIPLPIDRIEPVPAGRARDRDVVVLGFVFPDRGYESVVRALPSGSGLVALGRTAAGHEDLAGELDRLARDRGATWRLTGFVPDAELAGRLTAAAVPVAPNRRVGASASIGTWLAHGRRPIVPATPYTEELLDRMPGGLRLYDAEDPGELGQAIRDALEDPASTWLPATVPVGPSSGDVAAAYLSHLGACASPRTYGAAPAELVPDNRWDLLRASPDSGRPLVSVVIPYFEDQRGLDLVLAGLREQTVRDRLEVVVADDGSPVVPDLGAAGSLPARLVRQERRGFGAARARNLGARAARGELLAFLDGDTVPQPDYLERLLALPRRHLLGVAVGRRVHADFAGWAPVDVTAWSRGEIPAPPRWPDPEWLAREYIDTHDLRDAGPRAYRFVISAVLGLRRDFFDRVGGFDERFTAYGGEDWEFANRAWHAGALIKHEPRAEAWHDGPDWAARPVRCRQADKNTETLMLSALLPDPGLRGHGQWMPYPHVVVQTALDDPAQLLLTVRSAFAAAADCAFWLVGPEAVATAARLGDPRITAGSPPADVVSRAAVLADVVHACDLSGLTALAELAQRRGLVRTPALTLRANRAVARCAGTDEPDQYIGTLFGHHDRSRPTRWRDVRLDRDLPRMGRPGAAARG